MSKKQDWRIVAYTTHGARWDVVTGLSTREAADRALTSLLGRDGLRAADASGRMTAVTFAIEEET